MAKHSWSSAAKLFVEASEIKTQVVKIHRLSFLVYYFVIGVSCCISVVVCVNFVFGLSANSCVCVRDVCTCMAVRPIACVLECFFLLI